MGESLRTSLNELAEVAPDWLLRVVSPDWFDRSLHRFELQRFPKGQQAQDILRSQVGEDSWHRLASSDGRARSPRCPGVLKFGALASLVWHQNVEYTSGVVRGPDGPVVPNAERVVSPYEADARVSRKRDTEWLGYKVRLTETCSEEEAVHLIVQAEVTAATVQDVELTMPLLLDLQTRDLVPEVRLVNSGYVSGQALG